MKRILQLEELSMAAAGLYVLSIYNLGLSFWIWVLLFFSPDISMLGYMVNTRAGAFFYNIVHHKAVAVTLAICGFVFNNDTLIATGALFFAHSSFDRIFGYGLKFGDSFQNTHLGRIGKRD